MAMKPSRNCQPLKTRAKPAATAIENNVIAIVAISSLETCGSIIGSGAGGIRPGPAECSDPDVEGLSRSESGERTAVLVIGELRQACRPDALTTYRSSLAMSRQIRPRCDKKRRCLLWIVRRSSPQ